MAAATVHAMQRPLPRQPARITLAGSHQRAHERHDRDSTRNDRRPPTRTLSQPSHPSSSWPDWSADADDYCRARLDRRQCGAMPAAACRQTCRGRHVCRRNCRGKDSLGRSLQGRANPFGIQSGNGCQRRALRRDSRRRRLARVRYASQGHDRRYAGGIDMRSRRIRCRHIARTVSPDRARELSTRTMPPADGSMEPLLSMGRCDRRLRAQDRSPDPRLVFPIADAHCRRSWLKWEFYT